MILGHRASPSPLLTMVFPCSFSVFDPFSTLSPIFLSPFLSMFSQWKRETSKLGQTHVLSLNTTSYCQWGSIALASPTDVRDWHTFASYEYTIFKRPSDTNELHPLPASSKACSSDSSSRGLGSAASQGQRLCSFLVASCCSCVSDKHTEGRG